MTNCFEINYFGLKLLNSIKIHLLCKSIVKTLYYFYGMERYCSICTLDTIHRLCFVTRLIINKITKVQWVDFKLENVLVSLHSLITTGLGSIIVKEWRVTRTFSYAECLIEWLVGKAISYRGSNDLNEIKTVQNTGDCLCCSTFSYFYFHNITFNKTNIGSLHQIAGLELSECDEERFEDTIGVIRSRNSRKDRQLNGL